MVRRARRRDLDRLAALWEGEIAHHAGLDAQFRLRPGSGDRVRAMLEAQITDPAAAVFVWDVAGDLRGFCAAHVSRAPPLLEERERAEITDVFVRDGERRRGIGRALAEAALAWVEGRGVTRVEVRVAVENAEGQGFWRALGFGDLVDVLHRRL